MNWIINEPHNLPVILCGIFYSILCIFSIVTGLIYASGKKRLNPLELPDTFIKSLNTKDKYKKFTIKMGWITFIVGVFQGLTALAIFKGYNIFLDIYAILFTIFSIISVVIKLKGKINAFPLTKLLFYIIILLVLLVNTISIYPADKQMKKYLKSNDNVKVTIIKEGYFFDGKGKDTAIIFIPGAGIEYTAYSKMMFDLANKGVDSFLVGVPLNIALLGVETPSSIIKKYDYNNYYLVGHSLGGVAASQYGSDNPNDITGIIALASYPAKKIPNNIQYISIYGSKDKILNKEKYKEFKKYLPDNSSTHIITGGNHSGFANYGNQSGDGKASITRNNQQKLTVDIILQEIKK